MRISEPMKRVIRNLAEGKRADAHVFGMSAHGGLTQTMAALHKRGLLTKRGKLSAAGYRVAQDLET